MTSSLEKPIRDIIVTGLKGFKIPDTNVILFEQILKSMGDWRKLK